MNLAYPYRFDHRGRTGETGDRAHIRDLIEEVLFTAPGERVMLPDFGSGADRLVFAPNSSDLAAATQMLVQSALQRWLSDRISVLAVRVEAEESSLVVLVQYQLLQSDQVVVERFERGSGATP